MSLRYTAVSLINGRFQHQKLVQTAILVERILVFYVSAEKSRKRWVVSRVDESRDDASVGRLSRTFSISPSSSTRLRNTSFYVSSPNNPSFTSCLSVWARGKAGSSQRGSLFNQIWTDVIKINKFIHLLFLLIELLVVCFPQKMSPVTFTQQLQPRFHH